MSKTRQIAIASLIVGSISVIVAAYSNVIG